MIYNSYPFERIREEGECPLAFEGPYIIHVGRFSPQKRHDLLFEAFSGLSLPHKLVLLTHKSEALEKMIGKYGLTERVYVAGFQEHPFPWIKGADVLVLCSDYEGLGNVLVESLILGTKVVSTDCLSGPKEIVGNLAQDCLVPTRDVSALQHAIYQSLHRKFELPDGFNEKFSEKKGLDAYETIQARPQRVAFLLDNLNGGGAERVVLDLASGVSELGYEVDLLVCDLSGELCKSIPDGVNLVVLEPVGKFSGLCAALKLAGGEGVGAILSWVASARKVPRCFRYIGAISDYLQARQPVVISTALSKSSIIAVLAASTAGVNTRVYVGIQVYLSLRSEQSRESGSGQVHSMVPMFRYCFPRADAVIAASRGVAEDAISFLGLDPERVHVVYNPVFVPESIEDVPGPPPHPWFRPDAPPVILGIGRLVNQKNFPLLIRAFVAVRRRANVRLVILGGDESSSDQMAHRQTLQDLATELGVGDDVALLGYQSDPHVYLREAGVFVLSSSFEGFGIVLVEALLAGCPVVSTDCPSGPAEILDAGSYGTLVPVNDAEGLSNAILTTLGTVPDSDRLRRRGGEFSLERALDGYHQIFFGESPAPSAAPTSSATRQASGNHKIIQSSRGRVTI